jgi:hypothetical protein
VLSVQADLKSALPIAANIQAQLQDGQLEESKVSAGALAERTRSAKEHTRDGIWTVAEQIPFVGANLAAVRATAEVVDDFAQNVIIPITGVDLTATMPGNGAFDVAAIAIINPLLLDATADAKIANTRLLSIDRDRLLPQVSTAIDDLLPKIDAVIGLLEPLTAVTAVLPDALGASGPRNYLMLFQNNAESRGTGGNPAAMALLRVADGALEISEQASSSDFQHDRSSPITMVDEETLGLYGDKIVRYVQDLTLTPDFPTSAAIATAWWLEKFGDRIDGVLSFDPVALSYLLGVTGPVTLPTGDVISSQNAVALLLNEVYFRYEEPGEQDAFFAMATASIFDKVKSGSSDTLALGRALARAVAEGRLMVFSTDAEEAELVAGKRIGGQFPSLSDVAAVAGVYINDTTGSKMDFYMDVAIGADRVCSPGVETTAATVTLKSRVDPLRVDTLPEYITGQYYDGGRIATDVVLYAPPGQSLTDWSLDGQMVSPQYVGTHLGRAVAKLSVILSPGESATIRYSLAGNGDASGVPLTFYYTPMVRPTLIEVREFGCTG